MRMIFAVLGLLLTLAVVGWVVKQQVQSVKTSVPASAMVASESASKAGVSASPGNQVQHVRSQVEQALAQGAAARASAAQE